MSAPTISTASRAERARSIAMRDRSLYCGPVCVFDVISINSAREVDQTSRAATLCSFSPGMIFCRYDFQPMAGNFVTGTTDKHTAVLGEILTNVNCVARGCVTHMEKRGKQNQNSYAFHIMTWLKFCSGLSAEPTQNLFLFLSRDAKLMINDGLAGLSRLNRTKNNRNHYSKINFRCVYSCSPQVVGMPQSESDDLLQYDRNHIDWVNFQTRFR